MVEFEFSMGNCDFGGRIMVGSMFIYIREHAYIDLNELIVIWVLYVCIDWLRKPSFVRR